MNMNKYFDDKVIWITGASSGIGEALVKELAESTTAKIILSQGRKNNFIMLPEK
jgi:NADP-dependent 3-hydroxy acid dehydrogenase YdfG